MNRSLLVLTLAGLLAPSALYAQAPLPYTRPAASPIAPPVVSPYLNLLRRGSSPAVNYYGLVRPEFEFRSDIRQLQQQVNTVAADQAAAEQAAGIPYTGHPTMFNNPSHYFPSMGTGPSYRSALGQSLAPT